MIVDIHQEEEYQECTIAKKKQLAISQINRNKSHI